MDFISEGYITIRDTMKHILRATHAEDWGQKEVKLESEEATVPSTNIGNGVTLRQGYEVMLKRVALEIEIIVDTTNHAVVKQPFYPHHELEL
jgi:hypothetical protein